MLGPELKTECIIITILPEIGTITAATVTTAGGDGCADDGYCPMSSTNTFLDGHLRCGTAEAYMVSRARA
jgi:hypothetical protein